MKSALESVVLHAPHEGQPELAAARVGVREPRGKHVRHGVPQPRRVEPGKGEYKKTPKQVTIKIWEINILVFWAAKKDAIRIRFEVAVSL